MLPDLLETVLNERQGVHFAATVLDEVHGEINRHLGPIEPGRFADGANQRSIVHARE